MSNIFRELLQSNAVLVGAQLVQMALSLLRLKVVAVLLGPAGVGLLGAYNSLQSVCVTGAGLGMASSGVKQIARATADQGALLKARFTIFFAHLVQGIVAFAFIVALSSPISQYLTGTTDHALEISVIGGVTLVSLLSGSQIALLQGLRRTWDLAKINLIGGVVGTVFGLLAVLGLGSAGLVVFMIVQPMSAVLTAFLCIRRLSLPPIRSVSLNEFWTEWRGLASLGLVFMLGTLCTSVTLLLVRAQIVQELGLDGAGYFAAAWGVSSQCLALLLAPLTSDYYPRVSASANDLTALNELSNAQTQLLLSMGGPGLLVLLGFAHSALGLLYSTDFEPAWLLLQVLILGGLFKLGSWPLSFILIAGGNGRLFLFTEIGWNVVFGMICWLAVPHFGLVAAAVGYTAAYAAYFLVIAIVVSHLHGVRLNQLSLAITAVPISAAALAIAVSSASPFASLVIAVLTATGTLVIGVRLMAHRAGIQGLRAITRRVLGNRR